MFKQSENSGLTNLRLLLLPAVAFASILIIGGSLIVRGERYHLDEQRQTLREIGVAQAHLLERQLDRSLSSTYALASILRHMGRIDNFDRLAGDMIRSYGGISNLQLAPQGVVSKIYPLEGNEAAIGHDLLKDPRRRTEALAAIESRTLTLAGPLALIQEGMAVIGRYPVFIPDDHGAERFWGFTIALIRLPSLLKASKLNHLVRNGYDYEISRINPDNGKRIVFARSSESDIENPVSFEIVVPNGKWQLVVTPSGGWQWSSSLVAKTIILVLMSMLVASFVYALRRQPEILRREVQLRTRELAETNRELEAQIVERHRAEEQVLRYSEELEDLVKSRTQRIQELEQQRAESEKLAATGRLAARIAHEINNPLAGIKNSFLLIKDAVPEDHPYYEYVDLIDKEIDRIARVVRHMYDLYRSDRESPRKCLVNETIREVVTMLERSVQPRDVTMEVVARGSIVVNMPEGPFRQVLYNLIQNSIDASPDGEKVKIETAVTKRELTITVTDHGSGIPEEVRARIFEPFFTTKGELAGTGLGLGLSVSKRLLETMGGSLQFKSEVNEGTVFRVVLPLGNVNKEEQVWLS